MRLHHIVHYLILLILLALGVAGFWMVRPNVTMQLIIGITTSVAYTCWGIFHHMADGDLHRKIVIEYMLIGAIAIVLLVTILGF